MFLIEFFIFIHEIYIAEGREHGPHGYIVIMSLCLSSLSAYQSALALITRGAEGMHMRVRVRGSAALTALQPPPPPKVPLDHKDD